MTDSEKIKSFFDNLGEAERKFALDTVEEYVFFSGKVKELSKMPLLLTKSGNKTIQKATPAAKLIKEYSQVVDAKRATLLRILNASGSDDADKLMELLEQFK